MRSVAEFSRCDRKCVLIKRKLIDKFIIILANNNLNFNIIIIFLSLNRLYIYIIYNLILIEYSPLDRV